MHGYYVKKINENRGKPRIWLEGGQVEKAGMAPGSRFDVHISGGSIMLKANPDGSRVVSKKSKGDRDIPIIDISSQELLALFDGMSAVRMVQRDGEIYLSPLATELRKKERLTRLRNKMLSGAPIAMGSLSHGGGVMSSAIHKGMEEGGVTSRLAFANEIRPELIEQARQHNDAWDERTIPLAAPLQELAFDEAGASAIPKVDVLEAGLPCSGHSLSGRAKRGTSHPEEHPEVGHLVVGALVIIAKTSPAIFVLENVEPYASSASASILRNQLRDLGYVTHERILEGQQWGDLENRKRWCMVAATEGLNFTWDMLQIPDTPEKMQLSDALDDIPEDHPMWSEMKGLKAKQERDMSSGKGFRMQILQPDADKVPTMTKGYAKIRSTDPKLAHPTNPDLLRQFTPAENARFKQIPPKLIEGLSNTIAHELLGQSVSYSAFTAVGRLVADSLREFAHGQSQPAIDMKDLVERISSDLTDSAAMVVSEIRKPVPGTTYEGMITVCDMGMAIQDIGNGVGIAHNALEIDSEAILLGADVRISYPKTRLEAVSVELLGAHATAANDPVAATQDNTDEFDLDAPAKAGITPAL